MGFELHQFFVCERAKEKAKNRDDGGYKGWEKEWDEIHSDYLLWRAEI